MRVVCIDGAKRSDEIDPFGALRPVEGSIYEAEQHDYYADCYLIKSLDSMTGYRKFRFAPLSDIDEKEMEREWMLTPVELPNQVN